MLVSCSKEEYIKELRFDIAITEISDFSVTMTITHTGTNRVLYNTFIVPGEIQDIYEEIQNHRNGILDSSNESNAFNQKKRVIKMYGLVPEKTYTCIVYGIDENNQLLGTPSSKVFQTNSSSIVFSENSQWTLTYFGQTKYCNKTFSKININVKGEVQERYFVRIYKKEVVDEYSNVRDFLLRAYADFNSEQNMLDDEYFWIESNFVRTGSTDYYKYLFNGCYQAFAIGVDSNGSLTGHYAYSDAFDFDGYELESQYAKLLGNWEIIDDSGNAISITLTEKWANNTLAMSGWGYNDCPLTINYTPHSTELLNIPGQTTIGNAWGETVTNLMTLRGWYLDDEGNFRIYTSQIIPILARANEVNGDGSYTFSSGFSIKLSSGINASTVGMVLTFNNKENKLHYYKSSIIKLPFKMRKID